MASKRKLVVIDGATGEPTPVGFKVRNRVPLITTPKKALQEAASVYSATRRGEIPPDVGARLVYMARTCSDMHEAAEVVPRLDELEQKIAALAKHLGARL